MKVAFAARKYQNKKYAQHLKEFKRMFDVRKLTEFMEISTYLKETDGILILFPDSADFLNKQRNIKYRLKKEQWIYLNSVTEILIRETGCKVYITSNMPTYSEVKKDSIAKVIPVLNDPVQETIKKGLVKDMEVEPTEWDRIKYFDRLAVIKN